MKRSFFMILFFVPIVVSGYVAIYLSYIGVIEEELGWALTQGVLTILLTFSSIMVYKNKKKYSRNEMNFFGVIAVLSAVMFISSIVRLILA